MPRTKTTSRLLAIVTGTLVLLLVAGNKCGSYEGSVCRDVLLAEIFYDRGAIDEAEKTLTKTFDELDDLDEVESGCRDYVKTLLCHLVFPYCGVGGGGGGEGGGDGDTASGRPVCVDDCYVGRDEVCQGNQWHLVANLTNVVDGVDLSTCDGSGFGGSMRGGDEPECWSQVWKPQATYGQEQEEEDSCYVGIGRGYAGKVAVTRSGYPCQNWASQSPHAHSSMITAEANYCRNPEGRAAQPWCYTTNSSVRWEECNVPRCHPDLVCDGRVSLGCPNFEIPNVERFWNTSEFDSAEKLSIFVLLLGKNDTCFRRISRLMCLIDMPLCDASSPEPRPLSVCREYCESLTDDVCAKHWKWIEETIKENPKFSLSLLPKCDEFPSQYDEESFECIVEEKMPPKEEEFTKDCYSDRGAGYVGTTSVTESGLSCQAWTSQYPHAHLMNNPPTGSACRNPDERLERPWCYTTDTETRWEYCDVPKCSNDEPAGESHSRYIIASVVGGVGLLLFVGLCAAIWRRQKKRNEFQCCCRVGDARLLSEDDYLGEFLIPNVAQQRREMEMEERTENENKSTGDETRS
ncbi:plasminogen-like [Oscarella lobularis]|uniref:plasminogen-like n=1 Tax=Oscarella lobularis TaxID=121494 RepID=UPI0033132AB5